MTIHTLEPAAPKRAGLVAVDGHTYPLSSVRIAARAEGGIAMTTVTQVFDNPHDEALEVIYTLPLPADGSVLGYTIRIGGKLIRGEIEPREKALAVYEKALHEGRTAGLLEQDRDDTFQQRLGNLPARTGAEVEIEVLQPLAFLPLSSGTAPAWEYRFPTVTGVRYEGAPGRVHDAGRLDVNRDAGGAIPTRAEFALTIGGAGRVAAASSPSHAVDLAAADEGTVVRFRQGERLDRDIAVRWEACAGDVGVRFVEGRGLEGDAGRYALLTIVPPAAPADTFHRDLTILVDASGSMSGAPLAWAKRVVCAVVESLDPGDRFEIIAFADRLARLTGGLENATDKARRKALAALDALRAGGSTEMAAAVDEALRPLREDAQRQVVLLTDGYIGFEQEIVRRVATTLPPGCRLHAAGIGSAPNRTLIHGAARAGRGAELIVSGAHEADEAAARLRAATARPVLTDLEVRGSALEALAPARPVDVFAARPVVLTTELKPAGGALEIKGRIAGSREAWRHGIEVPALGAGGLAVSPVPIGALHGREVIADLEQQLAVDPSSKTLLHRIESRGMRHRITSRRTSLVAIAEEPAVDPKQPRRREKLAAEVPAGVSAEGAGLLGATFVAGAADMSEMSSMLRGAPAGGTMAWRRARVVREDRAAFPVLGLGTPSIPLQPGKIIHRHDDMLVVEFEVPTDGFELPEKKIEVLVGSRRIGRAKVEKRDSSPRGPHAAGLIVRLALRFEKKKPWPEEELILLWKHQGHEPFIAGVSVAPEKSTAT